MGKEKTAQKKIKQRKQEFITEYKTFINRGNVIDMAIAIIVGAAFTKIVSSFAADIISPLLSLVLGQIKLTEMKVVLIEATESAAAVTLNYGNFLQMVVDFLITTFFIFVAYRIWKKMKLRVETRVEQVKKEWSNTEKDSTNLQEKQGEQLTKDASTSEKTETDETSKTKEIASDMEDTKVSEEVSSTDMPQKGAAEQSNAQQNTQQDAKIEKDTVALSAAAVNRAEEIQLLREICRLLSENSSKNSETSEKE